MTECEGCVQCAQRTSSLKVWICLIVAGLPPSLLCMLKVCFVLIHACGGNHDHHDEQRLQFWLWSRPAKHRQGKGIHKHRQGEGEHKHNRNALFTCMQRKCDAGFTSFSLSKISLVPKVVRYSLGNSSLSLWIMICKAQPICPMQIGKLSSIVMDV